MANENNPRRVRRAAQQRTTRLVRNQQYQPSGVGAQSRRVAGYRTGIMDSQGGWLAKDFTLADEVYRFIQSFPDGTDIILRGQGDIVKDLENYDQTGFGWATIRKKSDPAYYRRYWRDVMDSRRDIFNGHIIVYRVVWK